MPKDKTTKTKKGTAAPSNPWRQLTAKEVDLILKDETTFAEYLVTLSVEQIDAYLLLLKSDKTMDKATRESFMALLENVRVERDEADRQAAVTLAPLVSSAMLVDELDRQIEALEAIQKEVESAS